MTTPNCPNMGEGVGLARRASDDQQWQRRQSSCCPVLAARLVDDPGVSSRGFLQAACYHLPIASRNRERQRASKPPESSGTNA